MTAPGMLSVADMRALVLSHCASLDAERVPLLGAAGRPLAAPVQAVRDLPGVDNSAMDGVGVRSADVVQARADAPVLLRLVGAALPGGQAPAPLEPSCAVRIMTGAAIPPGVDAVVMRELCDEGNIAADGLSGTVGIKGAVPTGQHIRLRGEDVRLGATVADVGDAITPARLNLLLAAGIVEASVNRAPRVCVLASGDELREVGAVAGPTDVVNSNAHAIAASARALGCQVEVLGIARDTLADHVDKIGRARDADVLLTIGGVSAGTHDFVRPALRELGADLVAHQVAMRPGKPLAFARLNHLRVFGLPGNPVSAMVSFVLFVAPALRRLAGFRAVEPDTVTGHLAEGMKKKPGLEHFARGVWRQGMVTALDKQGSHQISALAAANVLIVMPADAHELLAGAQVQCIRLQ
jgi:molybdopterin molybdotransferase